MLIDLAHARGMGPHHRMRVEEGIESHANEVIARFSVSSPPSRVA
jgi:hypothetical protein